MLLPCIPDAVGFRKRLGIHDCGNFRFVDAIDIGTLQTIDPKPSTPFVQQRTPHAFNPHSPPESYTPNPATALVVTLVEPV